jgi:biopolymer transport protein ExbD
MKPKVNFDLTPLIDIIFQLVIFFMITSVFKVAPGIVVDLPTSKSAQTVTTNEIRILAVTELEIYVNKDRTNIEGLKEILLRNIANDGTGNPQAILEADKKADYQLVVSVLDAVRQSGITNVSLVTGKEKAGS